MIFFNNQLMKTDRQLRLFLVGHPKPFERFEDHAEALYIQLLDMVEQAIEKGENPIALIENFLEQTYHEGDSPKEMADFILHSPQMQYAMHGLRDHWTQMDESLPEDSLMYGGVSKEVAREIYSQVDLHTYLEALSDIYSDFTNPS